MGAFSELVDELTQDFHQAPAPMIERAIRNTCIDFCEKTTAYRKTLDAISLVADQAMYTLNPPEDTAIIQVQSAQIEQDNHLLQVSPDQLDLWWHEPLDGPYTNDSYWSSSTSERRGSDWRQYTESRPKCFYVDKEVDNAYRIRLVGIPTAAIADALVCRVALKPMRAADSIDDWLIEEYFQTFIEGAKSRIYALPGRAWSNASMADRSLLLYEDMRDRAGLKAQRDFIRDDETIGHVKAWV